MVTEKVFEIEDNDKYSNLSALETKIFCLKNL